MAEQASPEMQQVLADALTQSAERAKYEGVWRNHPRYRDISPGLDIAPLAHGCFQGHAQYPALKDMTSIGETLIDYGCGTGRAAKWFASHGYAVTMVDISPASLNPDMHRTGIPFVEACLWNLPAELSATLGFCADVLEHIPPNLVDDVLWNIARATTGTAFFQVACFPDRFGPAIGEQLHLTVQPGAWWKEALEVHWGEVRPLMLGSWSSFYCLRSKHVPALSVSRAI